MNTRLFLLLAAALPTLSGQTIGADPAGKPRTELGARVDASSIDRNAPDRVSYAPVVERSSESVVFVYSTRQVRAPELGPLMDDPVLRRFFGVPGRRGAPGAPGGPERTERGLGSGVIVSGDGYILTNNHVVEGADEVKVAVGESLERYDATVVGTDALADLAVLKIEADNLRPAVLGDSSQLKVGDVVLAIGNPFGVGLSVSAGIVSAVGRGNLGIEQIEDFIQTDAAINMGNSGGALIDSQGRVVGINTAILSRTGGFAGVGFAIPINLARGVAEQIVATGEVRRGFLGVAPQTLTPDLAERFKASRGALVAEVTPDSPAEKAGLRPGDVITALNGAEVADPRQLLLTVSQIAPGETVKVEYLRGGEQRVADVELDRRPDAAGRRGGGRGGSEGTDDGVLDGVMVSDLTREMRQQLQIPENVQGAVVTGIEPGSPASRQGLRTGDVIQEIEQQPVRSADDAVRRSEELPGPKTMIRIWRDGRSTYVMIDETPVAERKGRRNGTP